MKTKEIDAYDVFEDISCNKGRWIKIAHLSAEKQRLIKKIAGLDAGLEEKNNA